LVRNVSSGCLYCVGRDRRGRARPDRRPLLPALDGALEKLLDRLGLPTEDAIGEWSQAWRAAYLATPHGKEVLLGNGKRSG
jgi:hypothetical protein